MLIYENGSTIAWPAQYIGKVRNTIRLAVKFNGAVNVSFAANAMLPVSQGCIINESVGWTRQPSQSISVLCFAVDKLHNTMTAVRRDACNTSKCSLTLLLLRLPLHLGQVKGKREKKSNEAEDQLTNQSFRAISIATDTGYCFACGLSLPSAPPARLTTVIDWWMFCKCPSLAGIAYICGWVCV